MKEGGRRSFFGRAILAGAVALGGYSALRGNENASAQNSNKGTHSPLKQKHPPLDISILPNVNLAHPLGLDKASAQLIDPLAKKLHSGKASVFQISNSDTGASFKIAVSGHYTIAEKIQGKIKVEKAALVKSSTGANGTTYELKAGNKSLITIASTDAGIAKNLHITFNGKQKIEAQTIDTNQNPAIELDNILHDKDQINPMDSSTSSPTPTATPDKPNPTTTPTSTNPTKSPWYHQGTVDAAVVEMTTNSGTPAPLNQIQDVLTGTGSPATGQDSADSFFKKYGTTVNWHTFGQIAMDMSKMPNDGDVNNPMSRTAAQAMESYAESVIPSLKTYSIVEIFTTDNIYGHRPYTYHTGNLTLGGRAFVMLNYPSNVKPTVYDFEHETNHALGMQHERRVIWNSDPYTYSNSSTIQKVMEYGNYSVMGNFVGNDIVSQQDIGFIDQSTQVEHVTTSGDYTIYKREDNRPGYHAISIDKNHNDHLFDQPVLQLVPPATDTQPLDTNAHEQFQISYVTPTEEDALYSTSVASIVVRDTHLQPSSPMDVPHYEYAELDATNHKTFTDSTPEDNFSITVAGKTTDTITLHVVFNNK